MLIDFRLVLQSTIRQFKLLFSKSFDVKTQILIRSAIIGVVVGIVGVAFRALTESLHDIFYDSYYIKKNWYEWLYLPFICTLGGLLASLLTQKVAPEAAGSGIPQVKNALNRRGVHVRLRTVFTKFFGAMLGIASGLSLGREGPTIQVGAGVSDKINQSLGGKNSKRAMASGAGAGLAAAFNTPIAGVLFVLEELDHDFSSIALGPAIVGAVTAAVTTRMLYGNYFIFHFQSDPVVNFGSMPLYMILGIICGLFGILFQQSIMHALDFYQKKLNYMPAWSHGAVAGLITGLVGLWLPQAIGGGHITLEGTLAQAYIWWLIPIIFIFKFFLTTVAYGSGVPGGIFAPALVLGALLGVCLGNSANALFPALNLNPATFAFVGMGAFFTGISRAPITSIVMLFELTGNYNLILPLMFGCIIANVTAEKFYSGSIYENLLKRDGNHFPDRGNVPYLQRFAIEQAMNKKVESLSVNNTLGALIDIFRKSHHKGFPVVDENDYLLGIVTQDDLDEAVDNKMSLDTPLAEIMTKDLIVVYPQDNLQTAILQFYENKIGRLLVVDPKNPKHLLGIITRSDIINYEAFEELNYS